MRHRIRSISVKHTRTYLAFFFSEIFTCFNHFNSSFIRDFETLLSTFITLCGMCADVSLETRTSASNIVWPTELVSVRTSEGVQARSTCWAKRRMLLATEPGLPAFRRAFIPEAILKVVPVGYVIVNSAWDYKPN